MDTDTKLADGIYFDRPREGAPSFVKGRMSIQVEKAVEMLQKNKNEKGYVNFDLLQSKDGTKLYFKLNDWKPTNAPASPETAPTAPVVEEIAPSDIPF